MYQAPGSEIGFRGEEKLGGGLSAWFQCASTADFRGGTGDPEGWCSRNSAVGLKGSFGNIYVGTWDTPFKRSFIQVGSRDTGVFGAAFLLAGASTTTSESAGGVINRVTFKRRQRNLLTYETPVFSGFQLMGAFSSTNAATGVTSGVTGSKPRIWSLAGQYRNGPLRLTAGYERHSEFGTTAGGGDDKGWLVGAEYTFVKSIKVGGMFTEQKFETGVGAETKVKAWTVGVEWNIQGPHNIHASYTQADDTSGNGAAVSNRLAPGTNNGAKLWQVRYVHNLSKRTTLSAGYVKLDNDSAARYTLGGFGATDIQPGDSQNAFAVSIQHRF
jgi:predicted porin